MNDILSTPSSYYWVDHGPASDYSPLRGEVSAEVAVIGAGMVGLTAALLLQQQGRKVVVLEAKRVGEQTTGGSTAKVTAQHRLIYNQLVRNFGEAGAHAYAESNQQAIQEIRGLAERLNIDCDFETRAAYAYTRESDGVASLEQEHETASRLGLPSRLLRGEVGLPFSVEAALCFDNQAQFQPVKYLKGLARAVVAAGGQVFEQSRALDVDDATPCRITCADGAVQADEVIVATHLPFLDRAGFFARVAPRAHLGMAVELTGTPPDGMFISIDEPTHSFRPVRGSEPLMVAIGHAFRPGQENDHSERYQELERFLRGHFPVSGIHCRWMNMDYDSPDKVPYVGRMPLFSRHLYLATGFSAWGLTTGHVAGQILANQILERPNPYAKLYDAGRIKPVASAKEFVSHSMETARDFISDHLGAKPRLNPEELIPGEGAVMQVDGDKVAACRDRQGQLHLLSPLCTHLGCNVNWNRTEQSWDCSCHGSRFSADGQVIHGPAVTAMTRKDNGPES